jgi:hypothetical protein
MLTYADKQAAKLEAEEAAFKAEAEGGANICTSVFNLLALLVPKYKY